MGAWSAWNSSLFTAATFVDSEEKYKNAKMAMDLGLITAVATGLGVHYVYHEKGRVAAISAVATGIALYLAYYLKLKCNPNVGPYMMGGEKYKENKALKQWKPLSDDDIVRLQSVVNSYERPVSFVAEP